MHKVILGGFAAAGLLLQLGVARADTVVGHTQVHTVSNCQLASEVQSLRAQLAALQAQSAAAASANDARLQNIGVGG